MRSFWKSPRVSVLAALLLVLVLAFGAAAEEKVVTILGTSDLHGRIFPYEYATDSTDNDAGLALIQTLVKAEKAQDPEAILVDAGDMLQDNLAELFNKEPVHPMIEVINFMNYDAFTLGNHEFNFGLEFLNKNVAAFNGAILAANIYKEDGTRFVKPYVILERNGVRVAVVGLIAPHVPRWEAATPEHFAGLTFTDPVEEAKKVVKELEGQYDVLVGVFHLGDTPEYNSTDGTIPIAEACPEFSVIFGGHKHSMYDDKEANGVKLIEPGRYGGALAKATIRLEQTESGLEVKEVTTANLGTKGLEPDPEVTAKFSYVHETSLAEANKVVGQVSGDFIKRVDYITGEDEVTTMPTSQLEDTAVIDLINEVQMFYADADVSSAALFNFGSNLKQGPFKKKDVAFIYKYDNTLMGVNITGANLKKYMEWSAGYYNTYKPGDVTISFNPDVRGYNYDMFSGVTYDVDLSQEDGNRIKNVMFAGQPLQDDKVYKLAVNNYRFGTLMSLGLVKAEDKYFDSYVKYQDAGRVRDLIIKYLQEEKDGVLAPQVDNNWKIVGVNLDSPYKEAIFDMVRKGELAIPTSEDGRTLNVSALNVDELKAQGKLDGVKVTYTVKANDTLSQIAAKFNVAMQALAKLNSIVNIDLIFPGQVLDIPLQ